jgi:hypothetical protein
MLMMMVVVREMRVEEKEEKGMEVCTDSNDLRRPKMRSTMPIVADSAGTKHPIRFLFQCSANALWDHCSSSGLMRAGKSEILR